ncbi:MAG TPA: ABC transporter permease [Capsulimonadaceae bacterium]|nr:ABC transporter permease [Capsulimonadaceae bacterium]
MPADFKQAARMLRNSPVFAVTAVVTIALGIGASTAIFSVTNAVLLRPLPYKEPGRLLLACTDFKKRDVKDFPWSNADFFDLRNEASSNFEAFTAVSTFRNVIPREDGTPEQVRFALITTNFFELMGGRIVAGRDFQESDGQPQPQPAQPAAGQGAAPPRLPNIAILSYDYWRRRFGGSSAIFGRPMLGAKGGATVVGVLAPGFELLLPPSANIERLPEVWIAARLNYDAANRNNVQFHVIGRLKPGATIERAQSEVNLVAADLRRKERVHETAGFQIRLEPIHKFLVADVRPAILSMMGAVVFLLMIACANVANLFLVRVSLRERDLAVRTALGGSRWRLVRQMLSEALLVAVLGAITGLGLAWVGIRELLALAPENLPRLDAITIDPVVLAFAVVTTVAAAALFGIVPALRASRPDVMQILRASGRSSGLSGGALLRNGVVVAEVALCFVLLIGSGLMIRSFWALQQINPGFDPHHLLTFALAGAGGGGNKPDQRTALMRQIHDRLGAIPGVEAVTASFPFPLTGGFSPIRWGKEQAIADPTKFQAVDFQVVLPGYFEAIRTPLLEGRTFTEADNAPDRNLVVVDEALAKKAFGSESAIGKRILIRIKTPQPEAVQIIGVVAHQRQTALADAGREQIYFTDGFLGHGFVGFWALRTASDPTRYGDAIRTAIRGINPNMLITDLHPMEELVVKAQAGTRFSLLLISVFAIIATLLAAVGLYGVLSTVVRQRTAEIGVRMAMGADPGSIFQLVVGHGLRLSMLGIGVGLIAAAGLTRVMRTMLVGITPTDPLTFVAIAIIFLLIAAAGAWVPARRAAGLDPASALRDS